MTTSVDSLNISRILLCLFFRGTDFLHKLLESDFKEKVEKRWTIPLPFKTVTNFVKFLYAFELDENMSLGEIMEFIEVCGVYDEAIKAAAGELIERHLMKENAFEMVSFCQLHNMKKAVQKCKSYIVNNFENDDILDIGLSDKGIDRLLLREIVGMKAEKTKIEETVSSVRGFKGFNMTFDSLKWKYPTIVDDIGLYVEPGVNVEINLYINDACLFIGQVQGQRSDFFLCALLPTRSCVPS